MNETPSGHTMPDVTIYHNPHCSKSRQALQLLEQEGLQPRIIRYLENPPDAQTLKKVLELLGIKPIDLIRKKDKLYTELGLDQQALHAETLINAMVAHPTLIERPIVIHGNKAVIGRPAERILEIL